MAETLTPFETLVSRAYWEHGAQVHTTPSAEPVLRGWARRLVQPDPRAGARRAVYRELHGLRRRDWHTETILSGQLEAPAGREKGLLYVVIDEIQGATTRSAARELRFRVSDVSSEEVFNNRAQAILDTTRLYERGPAVIGAEVDGHAVGA